MRKLIVWLVEIGVAAGQFLLFTSGNSTPTNILEILLFLVAVFSAPAAAALFLLILFLIFKRDNLPEIREHMAYSIVTMTIIMCITTVVMVFTNEGFWAGLGSIFLFGLFGTGSGFLGMLFIGGSGFGYSGRANSASSSGSESTPSVNNVTPKPTYFGGTCYPCNPCSPDRIREDGQCYPCNPCSPDRIHEDGQCYPCNPCGPDRIHEDGQCYPCNPCSPDRIRK